MKLSCVIPAYRRHEMTVRHVEEALRSTRLPDEIVVVNDGGDPCLREMLLTMLAQFPDRTTKIIYGRVEEDLLWNFNGAVNLGVWLSQGDVIAIEDTDHIPDRDLYRDAMEQFETTDIERLAVYRKIVYVADFHKPMEEWVVEKNWGPNQMTSLIRRDLYLKLKGQDERFTGGYGYMAMDWHDRYNNIYHARQGPTARWYWAVIGDEGEPGLVRGMSQRNRRFYRENSLKGHPQHPLGILNFTYIHETL